jgi:hypothetical protein
MEQGLFLRSVPTTIAGYKRYAVIHQRVTSLHFFDALKVHTASAIQPGCLTCSAMQLHKFNILLAPL